MEEQIEWKIEGMSCTNCAMSVEKQLKSSGLQDIQVDFMRGEARFSNPGSKDLTQVEKQMDQMGFKVVNPPSGEIDAAKPTITQRLFGTPLKRFIFCLVFTLPLWLHMFFTTLQVLHQGWFQLILSLPVLLTGMYYFGRSGWHSLKKGIPNMNVLISIGALAAFIYSLYGTLTGQPERFMFYETSATIITLVFMGNWLESRTVAKTQASIKNLVVSQKITAHMLTYAPNGEELIFPVDSESLKVGDLILIRSGDFVPKDCKVLSGTASLDESILTGESLPVTKNTGDFLVGNSFVTDGNIRAYVTAVGKNTVLQHMLQLVQKAQQEKPPVQQLADKISAIFVPVVLSLAALAFLINYYGVDLSFTQSLMRAIAVLVIACPCAMGLATPAAVAVGLGRAAKKGILFKNAHALEAFKDIKTVAFDKTGTLTTGQFQLDNFYHSPDITEPAFKALVFTLEKYSNHPLATTVAKAWKPETSARGQVPLFAKVTEIKGVGMQGTGKDGHVYWAVSASKAASLTGVTTLDASHHLYLVKNQTLLGWVDFKDTIRPEAALIVKTLKTAGIQTILLSGDSEVHAKAVADTLGMDQYFAEQSPQQKLTKIRELNTKAPIMMVGDGINDSPALAAATVGVSLSSASQIAIQTADVILIQKGMTYLPMAMGLGKHTYLTIKQNLFWAFAYNILAIPIAACGLLSPSFAALAMGLSDVVLGFNSIRLHWKNVTLR